jgi:outer membrane protein OmpA-like peptidoglycan-associated protein
VPGAGVRDVKLSYVTDSPAWKPTYRILLDDDKAGTASLEAWAIVDNVSGEDWRHVTIGVGSTSALSFKYDLRSVRLVQRETLSDESAVAAAPPLGGSPYAVASGEVQVVGELSSDVVDRLGAATQRNTADVQSPSASHRYGYSAEGAGSSVRFQPRSASAGEKTRKRSAVRRTTSARGPVIELGSGSGAPSAKPVLGGDSIDQLAQSIQSRPGQVRIEGFAKPDEADKRAASLARANAVRERLVAAGVPADKVEAVGTGDASATQGVRMVALDQSGEKPAQPKHTADSAKAPLGAAYFVSKAPMTLERGRSAMVSLLRASTRAETVYFYDPLGKRGSRRFAFRAVRLENPSEQTLDRGPFTVYARGQFLGEGLSEPIPPKSTAFIPFAMDRSVIVEPTVEGREEIDRLVTVERGIVTAETRQIRRTVLSVDNRSDRAARVFVRHVVPDGWALHSTHRDAQKLGGAYLLPHVVPAKTAAKLAIEEAKPLTRTLDVGTGPGIEAIRVYLDTANRLEPELRTKLAELVRLHREMVDLQQRLDTVNAQMRAYRQRADELNVQLVTLRRVQTAQALSRHLAAKMQDISERLQKTTLAAADLEQALLERRIRVQDAVAELSFERGDKQRVAGGE